MHGKSYVVVILPPLAALRLSTASTELISRLCPIFMVSNVTGHNLPMLRTFLNVLPSSQSDDKYVVDAPFEFQISDVFSVPFVGTVVVSKRPNTNQQKLTPCRVGSSHQERCMVNPSRFPSYR